MKIGTWKPYFIGTCNEIFVENRTWNLTIDFNFFNCQYWQHTIKYWFPDCFKGRGLYALQISNSFLPQNYVLFLPTSLIRTTCLNLSTCQQSSKASTQAPHVSRLFFQIFLIFLLTDPVQICQDRNFVENFFPALIVGTYNRANQNFRGPKTWVAG